MVIAGFAILSAAVPAAAQYCNPRNFAGAFGFQLSGTTTISGAPKPVASMGRMEFDGRGAVSGTSSVNFDGFLLGNPVTGTYEVRGDCTLSWNLQDDSGGFQHFTGKLNSDMDRATFRQTDRGGANNGTLVRLARVCTPAVLQGSYQFSMSGVIRAMDGSPEVSKVSLNGVIAIDPAGNLALLRDGAAVNAGTLTVDNDCIVNADFSSVPGEHIKLRGVLVSGGKEILAIGSDPGAAVNARFRLK